MANPIASLAGTWAEPLTFVLMLATFGLLAVFGRWPIGLALLIAAWAGAAANGAYLPLRHLVEGAFSYLDPILVIATAMIFMRILADGGALRALDTAVERRFGGRPLVLLPLLMLIIMFPGMITGSSTASVLTTGAMVASTLCGLGLPPARAAAIIAMGGVLGILCGVGAFIQVMTLTGGRGWLVSLITAAPPRAVFAAAGTSIPLFGAVSAFGSASVLGVPFLLSLLGRNEIMTTAALSLLTALGDLMLPAALAATLAAQAAGEPDRMRVLRLCVAPAILTMAVAILILFFAPVLGRWLL